MEAAPYVIEGGAGRSASSAPECLLCDAAIRRVRVRGPVERRQWKAERVEERLGVERRIDIGSPGERSVDVEDDKHDRGQGDADAPMLLREARVQAGGSYTRRGSVDGDGSAGLHRQALDRWTTDE